MSVNLCVLWMGGVGVIIFLLLYLSERAWELRGKGPMGPMGPTQRAPPMPSHCTQKDSTAEGAKSA